LRALFACKVSRCSLAAPPSVVGSHTTEQSTMASVSQKSEGSAARSYQRMCSSSSISTSGRSTSSMANSARWALHVARHVSTKEAVFRTQINLALAQENLDGIYQAWSSWQGRGFREVPLDNREIWQLRRSASFIACEKLRAAVHSGDAGSLRETLQVADAVASRFPYAIRLKSTRVYEAAASMHQEMEKADVEEQRGDDASTIAGTDREEDEEQKMSSPSQQSDEMNHEGATEPNEAGDVQEVELVEEHRAEEHEERHEAEEEQVLQGETTEEPGEEQWAEEWQEEWEEEQEQEEREEEVLEEEEPIEVPEWDEDESF